MDRPRESMGVSDFTRSWHADTEVPDGAFLLVEATQMSCQV